jgi:2-phosphoglycerate kinase
MKKNVVVKQTENEIPVEIRAESIKEISEAVRKLRAGRLTDRAIILLIHDHCGVGKPAIKAVLDGMQTLSKRYIK